MHGDYKEVVKNSWRIPKRATDMWGVINGKIKRFQKTLKQWVKKIEHSSEMLIKKKDNKIGKSATSRRSPF